MRVINKDLNIAFANSSHERFVGFITGPLRIIGGIAQAALNAVASVFSVIPSALGFLREDNPFHFKQLSRDSAVGILHIFRGITEAFPGSSRMMDIDIAGFQVIFISDNPYIIEHEW